MTRSNRVVILTATLLTLVSVPSLAQQRPLVTEDPESVGSGLVLIEGGFDFVRGQPYPVSGLKAIGLRHRRLDSVSVLARLPRSK